MAANVSLFDVLAAPQISGMIQLTKTGIPNPFTGTQFVAWDGALKDKTSEKDYGIYFAVHGTRTTAKIAAYGSPSQTRQLKGVIEVPVKLLHTVENIMMDMNNFMAIIKKESMGSNLIVDQKGEQEIARQVGEAKQNLDNLRIAALAFCLFQGNIWADAGGNLLPSATNAKTTIPFLVPAGNQNQLNWDGNGNIIDVSWDNPAADIDLQIQTLHEVAVRASGYPIAHAFYGRKIAKWLTDNSKLSSYFVRSEGESGANNQFLRTADIPNPLLGLQWHRAYQTFYEDASGNYQSIIPDNAVVFTPEPSRDWLGWMDGTVPCPGSVQVSSDPMETLRNVVLQSGMFGYAQLMTDPVMLKFVYGDTFLPVLKVPKAIWQATVQF